MDLEYFKVHLKGLPDSILRKRGRKNILHLRLTTLDGPVEIEFAAGDIIRTDDWRVAHALKNYRVPKANILHRPPGQKKFTHVYHDHTKYKRVKVFKKTKVTDKFQHEIRSILWH